MSITRKLDIRIPSHKQEAHVKLEKNLQITTFFPKKSHCSTSQLQIKYKKKLLKKKKNPKIIVDWGTINFFQTTHREPKKSTINKNNLWGFSRNKNKIQKRKIREFKCETFFFLLIIV